MKFRRLLSLFKTEGKLFPSMGTAVFYIQSQSLCNWDVGLQVLLFSF